MSRAHTIYLELLTIEATAEARGRYLEVEEDRIDVLAAEWFELDPVLWDNAATAVRARLAAGLVTSSESRTA
jgi:hypothetical protein